MIKNLKMDVQEMEKELKILRSEEALLDEDFADAEESHSGVVQVVNALQLEIKELQCDCDNIESSMNPPARQYNLNSRTSIHLILATEIIYNYYSTGCNR